MIGRAFQIKKRSTMDRTAAEMNITAVGSPPQAEKPAKHVSHGLIGRAFQIQKRSTMGRTAAEMILLPQAANPATGFFIT